MTLILGSKSPRRKEILENADIAFEIKTIETDELYPESIAAIDVPAYLSILKAKPYKLEKNQILLTADTIVVYDNTILGKPLDRDEAKTVLRLLSGNTHEVITGYTLTTSDNQVSKTIISKVEMDVISDEEIDYYIEKYRPFDKAGSYGIQEWIGHTKIKGIQGSYFNIMGLPIHSVYETLKIMTSIH